MNTVKRKKKVFSVAQHGKMQWSVLAKHDQKEIFNNTVKYIVKLRRDGVIDNDKFEGLVRQATTFFVENEISDRFDQMLADIIPYERFLNLP
ncbi:conserved hypothetical protein [delta proteobacterium NaphS2]|nr:conserved hypothetical protein [delta proteobacterium NaphS2]